MKLSGPQKASLKVNLGGRGGTGGLLGCLAAGGSYIFPPRVFLAAMPGVEFVYLTNDYDSWLKPHGCKQFGGTSFYRCFRFSLSASSNAAAGQREAVMHVRHLMTSPRSSYFPPETSSYARSELDEQSEKSRRDLYRWVNVGVQTCRETDDDAKRRRLAQIVAEIDKLFGRASEAATRHRIDSKGIDLERSGCSDKVFKLRPLHSCPDVRHLSVAPYKVLPFPETEQEKKRLDNFFKNELTKDSEVASRIERYKSEWVRSTDKVSQLQEDIVEAKKHADGKLLADLAAELKSASSDLATSRKKFYSELQFERGKRELRNTINMLTNKRGGEYAWWLDFLDRKYVLYAEDLKLSEDEKREEGLWKFCLTDDEIGQGDGSSSESDGKLAECRKVDPDLAARSLQIDAKHLEDHVAPKLYYCEYPYLTMKNAEKRAVTAALEARQIGGVELRQAAGVLGSKPKLKQDTYALVRVGSDTEHDFGVVRVLEDKTCASYEDTVLVKWLYAQTRDVADYNCTYIEMLRKNNKKGSKKGDGLTSKEKWVTQDLPLSCFSAYPLDMPGNLNQGTHRFSDKDKATLVDAKLGFTLNRYNKLVYERLPADNNSDNDDDSSSDNEDGESVVDVNSGRRDGSENGNDVNESYEDDGCSSGNDDNSDGGGGSRAKKARR